MSPQDPFETLAWALAKAESVESIHRAWCAVVLVWEQVPRELLDADAHLFERLRARWRAGLLDAEASDLPGWR